jgi:methyl-accepting chemotaxis protein
MLRTFRDFSIAVKFNVVLGVMTLIVITLSALWVSSNVRQQLEKQALLDLEKTNVLALSMFEAYDRALTSDIERSGRLFAAVFDGPVEVVKTGDAPQLMLLGKAISDQVHLVDAFSARSGTVASVFVRHGDNFLRTATSVKKEDGTRLAGTALESAHPARSLLLAGKGYTGKATLFGKDYITHYLPIKDSGGSVIGSFSVGFDMTEGLKALKKEILSIKIGDTGYIYAIDSGINKGVLTLHPSIEGKDLLATKDSDGKEFIREMVEKKSGVLRYNWANKDEKTPREKIAVFTQFRSWDWVIVTGSYLDEFTQVADSVVKSIIMMALAILLAVTSVCFYCTRKWVSQPLLEIVHETARIAGGDLTVSMRQESQDEIGRMKQSINAMTESLKKTIAHASKASCTMLDQSQQLVATAAQVTSSSQAQSDAATQMAAAAEEMSVSINQVAQHAHEAEKISSSSGQTAIQGGAVIKQATSSMQMITDTVREASSTISDLGIRSQEISSVVQVIREIADQTNLLALNAAIEAARAGEQGRGFAVVADEVRKLAERTTLSTQSIGEMVSSIQTGADRAIEHMKGGVTQVEQGSLLAEQAGRAIEDIHHSSSRVTEAVSHISVALSEQNGATLTIAQGIEGIAQKAEDNHTAALNSAQSAHAMREMALALDKDLSFFRVV